MNGAACLLFVTESKESLNDDILQIRLPDIDDVVHRMTAAERRMILAAAGRYRRPDIGRGIEQFVLKVLVQQADFPELIRYVFADIRHRTIRTDDDFVVVVAFRIQSHHPAAGVLAFLLEENSFLLTQLLEGIIPELQMENVAFARE